MPTAVDIEKFSKALAQRAKERERFKIVGYKLTVLPINEVLLTHQQKLPEKSHGKS